MSKNTLSWDEFLALKKSGSPIMKFNVITGSMEPLIPVGTAIVVDLQADYKVNDIIVFWQGERLIVHILWSINKNIKLQGQDVLVTRALTSQMVDLSITKEQVLGKVISHKLRLVDFLKLYLFKRS